MPKLTPRARFDVFALLFVGAIPLGAALYLSYSDITPEIELPARAPLPAPNGFDLYVEAAALVRQPNPPVDFDSDSRNFNLKAAAGAIRYGRARREAWHAAATPGWSRFEAAKRASSRAPENIYNAGSMAQYVQLRQLARDKCAESRLFRMRDENGAALGSALDCVEMGFDVARGGGIFSRLACASIVAVGLSPTSESDAADMQLPEQLSGSQARVAAARLEKLLANYPTWDAALQRGQIESLAALKRGFENENWRARDTFHDPSYETPSGGLSQSWQRGFISKRAVLANLKLAFADAISAQNRPYAPRASGVIVRDLISAQLAPLEDLRLGEAREKTQLNLLLLRLALQAYKSEKGVYPPNLAALKRGYLQRIPTDDFGGNKPYFYAVKGGDYRLWSVGPDGVNNGGKAIGSPSRARGKLPWKRRLPSMSGNLSGDFSGDAVARETR